MFFLRCNRLRISFMPQKRDFCSRCPCCSCFRVCRFPELAEADLSPCCPLLPAPFIPVVSPRIEDNTSPTFSLKLVEFVNKLQNGNWCVFFDTNSVSPPLWCWGLTGRDLASHGMGCGMAGQGHGVHSSSHWQE